MQSFFGKNKKLDHREASAAILMSKSCEKAKNRTTLTFRMVETSFIFTVVRHPFARLVSAYRYSSLGRSYNCGAPPFRQAGIRLQVQYCSLGQSYVHLWCATLSPGWYPLTGTVAWAGDTALVHHPFARLVFAYR